MGKLIDAEWLKKYVRNVGIYCDTDADKEYTCEKIDKFPTVEAIPVEYIERTMNRWKEIIGYEESVEALRILIDNWKIERKEE